jgi:DNA-binding response OmpR family regulator
MKILIIEDEPKVASFIREGLENIGHETDVAYDGLLGERLAMQPEIGLVILDVIIPHINGMDLCRKIKQVRPGLPVLMLTALGTTDDKVSGFEAGADDYLVKPFEFRELAARVNALGKRHLHSTSSGRKLRIADLELDVDKKVALRGGRTIELTAKEFGLLEYFMRNQGRVLSRVDIAEKVWEINFDTGTNIVDVYVNILRKKIDRDFDRKLIHTRIGLGYMFGED